MEYLIREINQIDDRQSFNLYFASRVLFTKDKVKELFKVLENKRLQHLTVQSHFLEKDEVEVILNFLNSSQSVCTKLYLAISDIDDMTEVLRAIKSRYSFVYEEIETENPVSKEAEELAMKY